mgnify:CR=1 FL=1
MNLCLFTSLMRSLDILEPLTCWEFGVGTSFVDNLSLISTDLISGSVFFVRGSGSAASVDLLFLFEHRGQI